MSRFLDVLSHLLSGLGLAALVVLVFSLLLRKSHQKRPNSVILGLLFGFGAMAAMVYPSVFSPGVLIDTRAVMLVLAAPFGGPMAAFVSMAMAALTRIYIGGAGVHAGLLGIAVSGGIGLAFRYGLSNRLDMRGLIQLGLLTPLYLFAYALLPRDVAAAALFATGPHVVVLNFAGVVLLGSALAYELNHHDRFVALQAAAERDPLTKLANRRALEAFGKSNALHVGMAGDVYAVVMFDLDHFKAVNDTFGHDAGDVVLSAVATTIRNSVRHSDFVARYGGEEILVVLPGASAEGAYGLAETVRQKIAALTIAYQDRSINATISAGVACFSTCDLNLDAVIKKADEALYRAKSGGRNRSEIFYQSRAA
ncbi:diguanylate cyclase [Martelella sp. HB161492]|uniref:GGDEF domain-containing protein n=1 Tax=Martelella sp. HB161492 TaxID=2720726 RepID=UPI001590E079|nr:diguanylate cyclase [Martelella sp. HB161492]